MKVHESAMANQESPSFVGVVKGMVHNDMPYLNSEPERYKSSLNDEHTLIKKNSPHKDQKNTKSSLPITSTSLNFPATNSKPKKEDVEAFLRQFIEPGSGTIKSPTVNNSKNYRSKRDSKGFAEGSNQKTTHNYYVANAASSNSKVNQESSNISKAGASNSLSLSIGEEKNPITTLSNWKNTELGKYKKIRYKLGKLEDVLERDRLEMLQNLQQNKNYSNMSNLVTRQLNRNVSFPALLRFDIVSSLKQQADERLRERKSLADETLEDSYELEPVMINVEATETSEEENVNQGKKLFPKQHDLWIFS
jgi:hypothetical protein